MRYPDCYFARFATDDCWGPLDRCHVLRQQDIKREWARANPRIPTAWHIPTPLTGTDLQALLDDPRNIVGGCRHHHHRADKGYLPYEPPESAREFGVDTGLSHYLPARAQAA